MPLQWLGSLQPVKSPLAQVFEAIQPATEAIGQYLAQAPDRETQMVKTFMDFYSSASPLVRQQLEQSPNFTKMVELAERRVPGAVYRDLSGRPRFAMSSDKLMQTHAAALQGYLGMPEDQRSAWEETYQDLLSAMAAEGSPFVYKDASGVYRVTPNYEQLLERKQAEATIAKIEAETEQTLASIDQVWKQLEQDFKIRWRGLDIDEEKAKKDIEIALKRIDMEKEQFVKTFGLEEAKFEEAKSQYAKEYALRMASFEFEKEKWAKQFGLDTARFELEKDKIAHDYALAQVTLEQRWKELGLTEEDLRLRREQHADQIAFSYYQFDKLYEQNRYEFEKEMEYKYADLAERKRATDEELAQRKFEFAKNYALALKQFEHTKELDLKKLGLDERQVAALEEQLGLQKGELELKWAQFGLSKEEMALKYATAFEELRLRGLELEELKKDNEFRRNLQELQTKLDALYKMGSLEIESTYRTGMLAVERERNAIARMEAETRLKQALSAEAFAEVATLVQHSPYLNSLPDDKKAEAAKGLVRALLKGYATDQEIDDLLKYFFPAPAGTAGATTGVPPGLSRAAAQAAEREASTMGTLAYILGMGASKVLGIGPFNVTNWLATLLSGRKPLAEHSTNAQGQKTSLAEALKGAE